MEKFFQDLFIKDSNQVAIYTLFGTKPMSSIQIIYRTQKDWEDAVKYFTREKSVKFQEKELQAIQKFYQEYDFHTNWEKWISFIKNYPQSPFLFSKRVYPSLNSKQETYIEGFIINIQEVIWTLQHHYELFKKELGTDFSPIQETLDFQNVDSPFWKKVFSIPLLKGILYGYGEKNAYFFSQTKNWEENDFYSTKIFANDFTPNRKSDSPSIKNIGLPCFRSYLLPFNEDPIRLKYIKERQNIQAHLTDENFFEKTLNQLTGNLNHSFLLVFFLFFKKLKKPFTL